MTIQQPMTSPLTKNPVPSLFFSFFLLTPYLADPRTSEAALICGSHRPPDALSFVQNFIGDLEALSGLISSNHWGTHLSNSSSNASNSSSSPVYGLAQCHSDLSDIDCLLCFAKYSEPVDPILDRAVCWNWVEMGRYGLR